MKHCTQCKENLEDAAFYKQQQKSDVSGAVWEYRDSMCKICRCSYAAQRRREIKLQIVEYLGGSCKHCGLTDDPSVFDCHHIDPKSKDFSLSKNTKSLASIKKELDKCILLCANCHRKVHSQKSSN